MSNGIKLFISHWSVETAYATVLKALIIKTFDLNDHEVFISSEPLSIGGGELWYPFLVRKIKESSIVIVLLSQNWQERPWLSFEGGIGVGADRNVIPALIRDFCSEKLEEPFKSLQSRNLWNEDGVKGLIADIKNQIGKDSNLLEVAPFISEMKAIKYSGKSDVVLVPKIIRNHSKSRIEFAIVNRSKHEITLRRIRIWITKMLLDDQFAFNKDPSIISKTYENKDGDEYVKIEYNSDQRTSAQRYETQPLIQQLPVDQVPILLEQLTYGLRRDFDEHFAGMLDAKIKWQIVTNEYATDVYETTVYGLFS